jgi:hypothetical protein
MKTIFSTLLVSTVLSTSANAGSVRGFFIPDSIENEAKAQLEYIKANSTASSLDGSAGKKVLRAKAIQKLSQLTAGMNFAEQKAAEFEGVFEGLKAAEALNAKSASPKARELLRALADNFLNK